MSELSKQYKQIIDEVEKTIKDPNELTYVKDKISDVSLLFMDIIDKMTSTTQSKIETLENNQAQLESKLDKLSSSVYEIESDIYEDADDGENDDEFEFEIVCPYCNHEFVTDLNKEQKNEIECPDCHNMIELDWNEESECGGHCDSCRENCYHDDEQISSVAEDDTPYEPEENKSDENDDDDM